MSRYLVLLRAVNVAGKNRTPMAELREAVERLGHSDIDTYLQSGNLTLSSDHPRAAIESTIQHCVLETFGHDITVIVRSTNELRSIIDNYPYPESPSNQAGVVFIDREIKLEDSPHTFDPDRFTGAGANVYVDCPSGFGRTKLSVAWIERRANCRATRRNWKTVLKLRDLLEQE